MTLKSIALFLVASGVYGQSLPNAVPMPTPEIQYLDQHGKPLAGAKLCTYAAGTSTPQATYTDSTAGTPNTNPIILDVYGRASVWVGPKLYKFVLRVGGDGTCTTGSVQWTQDNVSDTTLYFANYVKTVGTCTLITFTATPTGGVSRTCSAKLGERLSVQDFGAVDDWDGSTGTDNTTAIRAALSAILPGQTLWFPCTSKTGTCGYLYTDTLTIPSHITLQGDDWRSTELIFEGSAPGNYVINMIGADSVTITHLHFDSVNTTPNPKYYFLLGRDSAGDSAGHHTFRDMSIAGYMDAGLVYSSSSEEDVWDNVFFEWRGVSSDVDPSTAVLNEFHTVNGDDQGICPSGDCTTTSNLSIWITHCHFAAYYSGGPKFAMIYDAATAGTGDHIIRDNWFGLPTAGWAYWFLPSPLNDNFSGWNYVFESNRVELGTGVVRIAVNGTGGSSNIATGLQILNNVGSGQATWFLLGDSPVNIFQSQINWNYSYATTQNSSVYSLERAEWITGDNGNLTITHLATWSKIHNLSTVATSTIPSASFGNDVILDNPIPLHTLNGNLNLVPVAFSNTAPLNFQSPDGIAPTGPLNGDVWMNVWTDPYRGGTPTRPFFFTNSSTRRVGVAGLDYLSDWQTQNNGLYFDTNGRILADNTTSTLLTLGGNCGVGATVFGDDNAFIVSPTGAATACTITYSHAYATGSFCVFTSQASGSIPIISTDGASSTTAALGNGGAFPGAFKGICIGRH